MIESLDLLLFPIQDFSFIYGYRFSFFNILFKFKKNRNPHAF